MAIKVPKSIQGFCSGLMHYFLPLSQNATKVVRIMYLPIDLSKYHQRVFSFFEACTKIYVFSIFRVLPDLTIADLRSDIFSQLEPEKLPNTYVYVRGVGRHFTEVRSNENGYFCRIFHKKIGVLLCFILYIIGIIFDIAKCFVCKYKKVAGLSRRREKAFFNKLFSQTLWMGRNKGSNHDISLTS